MAAQMEEVKVEKSFLPFLESVFIYTLLLLLLSKLQPLSCVSSQKPCFRLLKWTLQGLSQAFNTSLGLLKHLLSWAPQLLGSWPLSYEDSRC